MSEPDDANEVPGAAAPPALVATAPTPPVSAEQPHVDQEAPPASKASPAVIDEAPPASAVTPPVLDEPPPPKEPPPPLAIRLVVPASAPLAGGVKVTVTGEGFGDGLRVWLGPAAAADVVVEDASLSFDAPPGPAGPVTVRIEAPDGRSAELAYAFRYDPAPLSVRLDPDWAGVQGRPRATLFGAHLEDGVKVEVDGIEVEVERFDGARIELAVPAHASGAAAVVAVNPDGQRSRPLVLTYVDAPVIESVSPNEASVDGGIDFVVRGLHFTAGSVLTLDGAPVAITERSAVELKAQVPRRVAGGKVDVRVVEEHGLAHILHGAFTYKPKPPPVVDAVLPPRGPSAGGTTIAVRGHDFLPGARVRVFQTDLDTTFLTADHLEVVTPPVAGGGPVDVVVTNPDGQASTLARGFAYQDALAPPRLDQVSPARCLATGGGKLVLLGDGFADGCYARLGGAQVEVKFLTHREVHGVVPAGEAGTVDVDLVNPDGQLAKLEAAFTFDAVPPPVIASVSPPNGPTTGGTKIVIEGEHFTDTCAVLVDRERPLAIPKRSKTEIVCVTPPRKSAGVVDVEVNVPGAGKAVKKNAFRYDALPGPVITGVTPNRIGCEGGAELSISGKNFVKESVVLVDGKPAKSVKLVDASTLEAKAPPGPNGKLADVVVKNPDGKEATQKKAVQFDARYD